MSTQERLLVSITKAKETESLSQRDLLDSLGLDLSWARRMPSATDIYNYCLNTNPLISKMVHQVCSDFEIRERTISGRINTTISPEDKKHVRVMVYSGDASDLSGLKLPEATHTMIIRIENSSSSIFHVTEPHNNPPIFFQSCSSVDDAIRYIEALLVDAGMCHYMKVSDAAMHHDEKQNISREKVEFIKELVTYPLFKLFDRESQEIIRSVADRLQLTTPYISFLSMFTVFSKELEMDKDLKHIIEKYFKSYYRLWKLFQIWYYKKHGLLFKSEADVNSAIETIFDRNRFQGQVSEEKVKAEITKKIIDFNATREIADYDVYAFLILTRNPANPNARKQCIAVFGENMGPASWIIKPISEISKYVFIKDYIEVIPFMIAK